MALKIVICLVAASCLITGVSGVKYCWDGSYEVLLEDGTTTCLPCEDGTFMPKYDHQEHQCFNCTTISNPLIEKMMSQCTKTHDAEIRCVEGYYREKPRNIREKGVCLLCKKCRYSGIPCKADADALCCQDENYVIEKNREDDFECRPKPWICGRGQFFNNVTFTCSPCPANTFMNLNVHSNTECYNCSSSFELPLHVKVDKSCNTTHPDVLRCETGYYLNNTMGSNRSNTGCSACTDCSKLPGQSHIGRPCSHSYDTVCCPDSSMTVVDEDGGPQCVQPSTEPSTEDTGKELSHIDAKYERDPSIPMTSHICCPESVPKDKPNKLQNKGMCEKYQSGSGKELLPGCFFVDALNSERKRRETQSQENWTVLSILIVIVVLLVPGNLVAAYLIIKIKCGNLLFSPVTLRYVSAVENGIGSSHQTHVRGTDFTSEMEGECRTDQGLDDSQRQVNDEIDNQQIGHSETSETKEVTNGLVIGAEGHSSTATYAEGKEENAEYNIGIMEGPNLNSCRCSKTSLISTESENSEYNVVTHSSQGSNPDYKLGQKNRRHKVETHSEPDAVEMLPLMTSECEFIPDKGGMPVKIQNRAGSEKQKRPDQENKSIEMNVQIRS